MGVRIGPNAAAINETTTSKRVNSTTYSIVSSDFNSDKCALTLTPVQSGMKIFTVTNNTGRYLLYQYQDESGVIAPGSNFKSDPVFMFQLILRNYVSLVGGDFNFRNIGTGGCLDETLRINNSAACSRRTRLNRQEWCTVCWRNRTSKHTLVHSIQLRRQHSYGSTKRPATTGFVNPQLNHHVASLKLNIKEAA